MNIIEKKSVPSVTKDFGTKTDYYIFPDHELHYNEMNPHTSQPWHHHDKVSEELFVVNGVLTIQWLDTDKKIQKRDVAKGTLIQVGGSIHTVINNSDELVSFLVLKYIPGNQDLHEQIKNDKTLDQIEE